jgi:hypothetical protein
MGCGAPAKAIGTPGQAGRAPGQAAARARAKGLGKRVQGLLHERNLRHVFLLNSGGLHAIAVEAV